MNYIDVFSGCGGLSEGFEKNEEFNMVAAVEWDKHALLNLRRHLKEVHGMEDANERTLHFDVQRVDELLSGWEEDSEYGSSEGLNSLIDRFGKVDLIIGGPPCQAYSVAGRIRDENGMRCDYRNYLFESYMALVREIQPLFFVFENVPGILSAKPDGKIKVTDLIRKDIEASGYDIVDDLREYAQIDMSEYGVPQKRKRVIILGIRKDFSKDNKKALKDFYEKILPLEKEQKKTVRDAIADLPKLIPSEEYTKDGKRYSHKFDHDIPNHLPRYHNKRDIETFKILCEDIEEGTNKYSTTKDLIDLYEKRTGRTTKIHKYNVLKWDEPSNTIPAHLNKDGLRHIHPDSNQARSITVREAARLQTFPDEYVFISSNGQNYKMIGNAVPPLFSEKLAKSIAVFRERYFEK